MGSQCRDRSARPPSKAILGVWGNAVIHRERRWYTHHSFGRVVERLATRFRRVQYYAPLAPASFGEGCDYPITSENIHVDPSAAQRNSLDALKRPDRLLRHYWKMTRTCDAFFLRGSQPLLWTVHWMALAHGKPVVHWIVGNPLAVMTHTERGYGKLVRRLGVQFARSERAMTRLAALASGAYILANGAELATIFGSRRTLEIVSTSITEEDFHHRADTCREHPIRLLFVGFVRPEKGLEYLIRALPAIKAPQRVNLAIVGACDQFGQERSRLERISTELGVQSRVSWEGYASFHSALFDQMDRSDILVLPSLSEGTPRVLIEARARSLPVVSTTVGGIPSSVTHGEDGLLVPPRDPVALASSISRLIGDGDLRRRLIHNGRENMRGRTVDRFVELVADLLARRNGR